MNTYPYFLIFVDYSQKILYLSAKKKKINPKQPEKINIDFSLQLDNTKNLVIIGVLFLLTAGLAYYYISYAFSVNKENCFPLDDPWIHLTFARNLIEYGSYSYFRNEMVTAGSTSPVYTLLLALFYIFIKNEYVLSFSLGILFFSFSSLTLYKLSKKIFSENWIGIVVVLIFGFDRWMNFFADSGMETTLYVFLLVLTYYFYVKRNAILTGISLGFTLWARPDAMAFIAAIIIDYLLFLYFKKESRDDEKTPEDFSSPDLVKLSVSFGAVVILYCGMNMMLSGTLFPNTFSAKTAYYSAEFRSRASFLRYEVWGYFTSSSYSLLIIPFIVGYLKIIYDCFKKRYNNFLLAGLFIFAIIFLYWYKLPFAAVKGRYLIPVIPFYILISVYGAREFFRMAVPFFKDRKIINSLNLILFGVIIIYTVIAYFDTKTDYAEQTHHISVRNLAAAKWINENTPPDAVIATHDIGAIGYYTKRKLLDVAGLISPQFTPKLFDPDFPKFLADEMKKNNVSYIAFIQEWYRVANENPLALCGDNNEEILTIYKFEPDKTHILGRDVNSYLFYSMGLIQNRQYPQAISALTKLYNADPASSMTLFFLGYAYFLSGDASNAEKNLRKALEIFPGYRDASYLLTDVYKKENKIEDAKKNISDYMKLNPSDTLAGKLLNTLTDSTRTNK